MSPMDKFWFCLKVFFWGSLICGVILSYRVFYGICRDAGGTKQGCGGLIGKHFGH